MFFTPKRTKQQPVLKPVERQLEPIPLMSIEELRSSVGEPFLCDTECYVNYFLVSFTSFKTGNVIYFELSPDSVPDYSLFNFIMWSHCIVGFNSTKYDLPMLSLFFALADTKTLKEASDDLILNGLTPYFFMEKYKVQIYKINHIDLIEVAPLSASLKAYAARMHIRRLQELPFSPHSALTQQQALYVRDYNIHGDNVATAFLYAELLQQIKLREALGKKYKLELRSKSDAQIAEAVIGSEIRKRVNRKISVPELPCNYSFQYDPPSYMQFASPALQEVFSKVCEATFYLNGKGEPECEQIKQLKFKFGYSIYQMGIGGLHSCESSITHRKENGFVLLDRDVASFYPRIKLNNRYYPEHLGEDYIDVYNDLVEERLRCKAAKDSVGADSGKIIINGGFGKLGSPYSLFYSPKLMVQVTITGQLSLLMLIESIEGIGISVVSANTDGIIIKCPESRKADLNAVIQLWEKRCSFETEETEYLSVHSRDVNNYIAVKTDGKAKTKGVYSEKGSAGNSRLSKNPEALVCADAAIAFITKGTPIEDTILKNLDLTRFVVVRNVKGGGHKNGVYLGKVVRWYYAKGELESIRYVNTGNSVANSEGGKPCMDLPPTFPTDIDYDRYIARAYEILYETGTVKRPDLLFML